MPANMSAVSIYLKNNDIWRRYVHLFLDRLNLDIVKRKKI